MSTFIKALFVLTWLVATSEQAPVHERIMNGHTIPNPSSYGGYGVHIITEEYTAKNGITYSPSACGGTLISSRVIVSAQHCFVNPTTLIGARKATFYIDTVSYRAEAGGKIVSCEDCWDNYPGYKGAINGSQNDLTVVTLPEPIDVKNIMLPTLPPEDQTIKDYANKSVFIVGWGFDENGDQPQTLKGVYMLISSYQYCQIEKKNFPEHICAKNINNNTVCSGDSGGGAVVDNQLIGIASFIYPPPENPKDVCFEVEYVAFITPLDKNYRRFIETSLKKAENNA
ncbi:serine protease SP24D-like [Euwallacea fornicatus]|uniref:serine protease SP24D-like n=1 Tax=Euwallacea fornicatus TaxID=995702 RepID=UPI00338EA8CE